MAKIVIDSDNFVKTKGWMKNCNMCPLGQFSDEMDECGIYFKHLFGDSCAKLKVELKDGKDAIELK